MALLEVVDISKNFGGIFALDKVKLHLNTGNILCLLGPSGCGKTTLLRIIAGLENADNGSVIFDGKGDKKNHDDKKRKQNTIKKR